MRWVKSRKIVTLERLFFDLDGGLLQRRINLPEAGKPARGG
jgi:hypothetical protein